MITEDIINELDKFIAKYKTLKSDNQNLNQFKADVKTALNSKGIINTSEDSEVINSVNTYTPPKSGGSLDTEYLKKVGLLPAGFVGTPTEKDLKVINFIEPNPYNDRMFATSEFLYDSQYKVELNGKPYKNYDTKRLYASQVSFLDPNKFDINNRGKYIHIFNLKDRGTFKVTMSIGNLVMEKEFEYDPSVIKTMGDYLIYAIRLNGEKILCYDGEGISMTGFFDESRLSEQIKRNVINHLLYKIDRWSYSETPLGYVLNIRTGKAYKISFVRDNKANAEIPKERRKYLATTKYDGKIDIMCKDSINSLSTKGGRPEAFIQDIGYLNDDILVFALHRDIAHSSTHSYPEEAVAEYLKKIFKGMPNHIALENGE